jgi:hypothetical protein
MRREFGVDEETLFEKWSYWQFRAYVKAIPKALGAGSGEGEKVAEEEIPSGAIDLAESDLGSLAAHGLSVKRGPG